MFLQKKNSLFHGLNLGKSLVFNCFDITKVSHDLHKEFLFLFSGVGLRDHLDTFRDIGDKAADVCDLLGRVVKNESRVSFDPVDDNLL
jgi:hypothetical protein